MSKDKDPQLKHRIFDSKKDESAEREEIEQKIDDLISKSNSLRIDKSMMEEPPEVECTPEDREEVDRELAEIEEEQRQLFHELGELDEKLMKEAEEEAKAREAREDEIEPPQVEVPEPPEVEAPQEPKEEKSEKDHESSIKRTSSKGRGRTYHGPIRENWARGSGEKTPLPKPTSYGGITKRKGEGAKSSKPIGLNWWAKELHDTYEEVVDWTQLEEQLLDWQNEGQPAGPQPTGLKSHQILSGGVGDIPGEEVTRTLLRAFKAWVWERYPEQERSQWTGVDIWFRFYHWIEYLGWDQIEQISNTYGQFLQAEEQGEWMEVPPLPELAVTRDRLEAQVTEESDQMGQGAELEEGSDYGSELGQPMDSLGEPFGPSYNSLITDPLYRDPLDPLAHPEEDELLKR